MTEEQQEQIGSNNVDGGGGASSRVQWRVDVLPKVKEVLRQFQASGVYKPTIRAVYYKLFSIGAIYENSQKMYKGLVRMLTDVRMEGRDPEVRPDTFADESRDSPDVDQVITLEQWVDNQVSDIKDLISGEITFEPHRWYGQPKYVEVWIEKQAMYSTFQSILEDYEVGIQSSKGFNSLSMLFEAYQRLKMIQNTQGREIVILYFGDLDPSGDSMDEDIQSRLDHFSRIWGRLRYKFIRVGVKPEHVTEYNLPPDPDEATAYRLEANDSRTRRFKLKYGKLYAIELDALAGQEPEAFRQLVEDAVEEHFDMNIWEQAIQENGQDKVKKVLAEKIKEELVPLIQTSTKRKTKGKKGKK
jgi:hypothetical protein